MSGAELFREVIVAFIGGGVVSAVIGWLSNRRKVNADATAVLNDAAVKQINNLLDRVVKLENEVDSRDREIATLKDQIQTLENFLNDKDTRIDELISLTEKQEQRIVELEAEVELLRKQQKPRKTNA